MAQQPFFIRNQLAHPSVLIRRECYHEVGGYSDFLAQAPDVDMWARLLLRHSIHVIPEELTKHRLLSDGSNTSGERIDVAIRVANEWSVVRKNYLDIDEFEKLVAIFPILDPCRNSSGYNVKFLLAMVCLKECSDRAAWCLGLEWLLELCGSEVHAKEIQRLYAFTYKDLIKLTGKFDVFGIGELAERDRQIFLLANAVKLREEEVASLIDAVTAQKLELLAHRQSLEEKDSMLALLTEDFAALRSEAALLKSSLSWKITAPLRALRRSLARPKVLIRRQLASGSEHATMLPQDPVPPKDPVQPEDASFAAFVHGHLDRAAYLEANPDVEAAGLDPVWHWLGIRHV
ncbi:MAG: hypothetical protein IPK02_04575 [Candidatus Accumulibacter sp.]|uniref:Uncharacterized protein n=1 Tax=Candidatus Accumulibacter affinis TaxID=2954384 RepID=A0A935TFI1_9PROT|nr:hypothetical protein [Candidatus Accumulibacter affinis]